MATLGIEISQLSPGAIELTMPYAAAYTQQHGFVHAGIVATALLDKPLAGTPPSP